MLCPLFELLDDSNLILQDLWSWCIFLRHIWTCGSMQLTSWQLFQNLCLEWLVKKNLTRLGRIALIKGGSFSLFLRARVTSVHVYFLFRFVFYVCVCQSCFLTFSFEIVVTWSITLIERSFNRCVLCFLTALINHSLLLHLSATSTLFMRLLPYSWTPWFCSLACYLGFGRWVIEHHVGFVSPIVLENNLLCWFLPTEIWRRCVVHGL